jgi:hypothetical protein
LTRIESIVFLSSSLQSIVIPRNVQFIDGSAFINVTLLSISIESGNEIFVIEHDFLIDILHHKLIRNFSKSSSIEIGMNIEIVGTNCFSNCESLFSITFESNSRLTRIESSAFSSSSLQSILIPRNVEILESRCFSFCHSLSSITFESNSHLTRIESKAFYKSRLRSILIPRNVEVLGSKCFSNCESLSSITFESNSRLTRIESSAFHDSSLQSILIPRNVEILGSNCFSNCESLSSIRFESNSLLTRIEYEAFAYSSLQSIMIPSTILFVASDAIGIDLQVRFVDGDSCPEFSRWLELKQSGIAVDFRRIHRVGFDVPCLGDYIVNLSAFETRSLICGSDEIPNAIYHRIEDEFLVVMKSKPSSENVEESQIENEIEPLINLRHPCIAPPIGFVFGIESDSRRELKIVRLYLEGCSLLEVVSLHPIWWTSTVKAKAVAGIFLGLRFAHSVGLIHGHLTGNNILFDSDHCIQIVDFNPIVLEVDESKTENEEGTQLVGFSRKGWTPERDIQAFASILFEVMFGRLPQDEASIPTGIPAFVSRIIESGLFPLSARRYSLNTILEILKQNDFAIEDGVDSAEVSSFVSWVEHAEWPDK